MVRSVLVEPRAAYQRRALAAPRAQNLELAVVALLTVVAFALRASQLHQGLIADEVFTFQDIANRSLGAVLTTVRTGGENSPPLFFALAWASAKLGDPTVWIRLPSLVLGSATVPVVYALGRQTVGRVAGLIAAMVIALAPFIVFYGIEARPYATMTFFVALSTLALLRAVETGGLWWWLAYALAAAAAAYSHYTSIFVLAVQAVWSLWACRERIREPLLAGALIVLLYLPWLPNLRGKSLAVIGALYPLGTRRVLTDLLRPIPGHPAAPLRAIPTLGGLAVFAGCVLAGAIALGPQRYRSPRPVPPRRLGLLCVLALTTPVGLLLYSLLVTDLWLPRGLSASIPATALVIGALLSSLPVGATALSAAAIAVTLMAGTLRSFDAAYARGPFRTIAAYLDRVAPPRDPVAIKSFLGAPAIPLQFQRPHVVTTSISAMWARTPRAGEAFLVLDDTIARELKIGTPTHPGFALVARRHYPGSVPTDVLTYRRLG